MGIVKYDDNNLDSLLVKCECLNSTRPTKLNFPRKLHHQLKSRGCRGVWLRIVNHSFAPLVPKFSHSKEGTKHFNAVLLLPRFDFDDG